MAAHNGERFLAEQLATIQPQLRAGDELIISVDPSTDGTLALARELARTWTLTSEARVTVLEGSGCGIVANFARALAACSGEVIFLADQDDVWLEGKVATVLEAFAASDALLICHDAVVVDEHLDVLEPSYFAWHRSRGGTLRTILRNSYVGCCLALRRGLLTHALPLPPNIPMHDQWLGLIAERHHAAHLLDVPLILYRRHPTTATKSTHASFNQMLRWRLALLRALL